MFHMMAPFSRDEGQRSLQEWLQQLPKVHQTVSALRHWRTPGETWPWATRLQRRKKLGEENWHSAIDFFLWENSIWLLWALGMRPRTRPRMQAGGAEKATEFLAIWGFGEKNWNLMSLGCQWEGWVEHRAWHLTCFPRFQSCLSRILRN